MKAIYGYDFVTGASTLFDVKKTKSRRYPLPNPVEVSVRTDCGILHARTEAGFEFDGRSGPSIIDWYVPNLGSLDERLAWWLHDCLGYGQSLSFYDTNLFLKLWLRDMAAYSSFKAEVIRKAVSLSKSWYGFPYSADDPWHCNVGKVHTDWRINAI